MRLPHAAEEAGGDQRSGEVLAPSEAEAGFWLLPVLETGRLVRWFAQLTLGWRGPRRGPPRR